MAALLFPPHLHHRCAVRDEQGAKRLAETERLLRLCRDRLARGKKSLPRVALQPLEACRQGYDRIGRRRLQPLELVPAERASYRRALLGAGRIVDDSRAAALFSQIVDEDLSLARLLERVRRVAVVARGDECIGDRLFEGLHLGPAELRRERGHEMKSLSSGRFEEALEAEIGEEIAHLDGSGLERGEIEPFVGIEIEYQPVGLLDMAERHAPIVDLERADLHQPEQSLLIADIEIGLLALAA